MIEIWTDGACANNGKNKGIGGWGAVLCFKEHRKEIYGTEINATNNEVELLAVIRAIEAVKTKQYPITIYSDSAYIVDCVNHGWYCKWINNDWKTSEGEPVKNKLIWKRLLYLRTQFDIKFVLVKGHSGIELNERADELAVMAKKSAPGYIDKVTKCGK